MSKITYNKVHTPPNDLITLLKLRGLTISDETRAERYLLNIGYYRLSAYCYPLLKHPKESHRYKQDATFDKVIDMYRFDKKLRLLVFNEVEKIEVAIRSVIVNTACEYYGDIFWMTKSTNFSNSHYFTKFTTDLTVDLKKSSEDFITHFNTKYSNPYPPAWIIAETLSLGTICHMYKNISDKTLKKQIAKKFNLQPKVFESWIMTLAGVRNICCHHSRLWNRGLRLKPVVPNKVYKPWLCDVNKIDVHRVYYRLCIIKYLLSSIITKSSLKDKINNLLTEFPNIDILAMGFTADWINEPLWND
ncbi:MAG: Abi family protein [Rikenellaceae bacterium]